MRQSPNASNEIGPGPAAEDRSPADHADSARDRALLVAAAVLGGLALYGLTAAPGVLWQDSATFQYRVYFTQLRSDLGLALAHPAYVLLARSFAFLATSGDFAGRVNLFSAFCAAVCLGVVMDLLLSLSRSRLAAATGALLLAVSHTFWRHATIAEVYGLYGLCLALELWLAHRFLSKGKPRWLLALWFVSGLNAANHLLAILHVPAYLVLTIVWLRRQRIAPRALPICAAIWLIGLSPYLALIAGDLFAGRSLGETIHSALFGEAYADAVLNVSFASAGQLLRACKFFLLNFPTPLLLLAPVGAWLGWKNERTRWFALVGGAIFMLSFAFAYRYPVPDQYVFFFACYLLLPMFAAMAVGGVAGLSRVWAGACLVLAVLPVLAYAAVPPLAEHWNLTIGPARDLPYRDTNAYFLRPWKRGELGPDRFAREALDRAAPDGLLIADSTIMNALVYIRDVEGVAPGVALARTADVSPLPPAAALEPEAIDPFAGRGRAFICADSVDLMPDWLISRYDVVGAGPVRVLRPAR